MVSFSAREPLLNYVVQRVERIVRTSLIVLVVTDEPAEKVRREDFGPEITPSKRKMARNSRVERDTMMDTRGQYEGSVHQEFLARGEEDLF